MIKVKDLGKAFGGLRAVDGAGLTVPAGSITGLIGPNGAGKTTLFSMIAGFIRPDTGTVLLDGEDVTGLPPYQLFRRGLIRTFQIPHEFRRMTVRENLMVVPGGQLGEQLPAVWFARPCIEGEEAVISARADEVLAFLKLDHLADAPAGSLSGGQKKLLELGRAMMAEPRLVLLDEPGAGVNPTLMRQLADAIRRLNRERGITFFLIEHDLDLVAELCDPVVAMVQGAVLVSGKMEEVRADPVLREAYLGAVVAPARQAS